MLGPESDSEPEPKYKILLTKLAIIVLWKIADLVARTQCHWVCRYRVLQTSRAPDGVAVAYETACAASYKVLSAVPFSGMKAGARE